MGDRMTGCVKADAPAKAGQVIMDKLEHAIARANNLRATAAGITDFMIGVRPEKSKPETAKPTGCYVDEVTARLNELSQILGEAQGDLEELRSQF